MSLAYFSTTLAISYQLSAIDYRLSVVSLRQGLPTTDGWLLTPYAHQLRDSV